MAGHVASVTPDRSVWTTLQVCASGSSDPDGSGAFVIPTRHQERFMIYDEIINGARNLAFYGGNLPPAAGTRRHGPRWSWTLWNEVLESLIEEISAKSPLVPALVDPESTNALAASDATTRDQPRRKNASDLGDRGPLRQRGEAGHDQRSPVDGDEWGRLHGRALAQRRPRR